MSKFTPAQQAANLKAAFAEHDIPWPVDPKKTLYWHPSGPVVQYSRDGFLHITDLNPEVSTRWRMSRGEMLRLGWRCMMAALRKARGE